jgi:uncharacterized small protein (DUF1192 family)
MTDPLSLDELDRRIAIVRENIRQLIEQAAARSGAADEALARTGSRSRARSSSA